MCTEDHTTQPQSLRGITPAQGPPREAPDHDPRLVCCRLTAVSTAFWVVASDRQQHGAGDNASGTELIRRPPMYSRKSAEGNKAARSSTSTAHLCSPAALTGKRKSAVGTAQTERLIVGITS